MLGRTIIFWGWPRSKWLKEKVNYTAICKMFPVRFANSNMFWTLFFPFRQRHTFSLIFKWQNILNRLLILCGCFVFREHNPTHAGQGQSPYFNAMVTGHFLTPWLEMQFNRPKIFIKTILETHPVTHQWDAAAATRLSTAVKDYMRGFGFKHILLKDTNF